MTVSSMLPFNHKREKEREQLASLRKHHEEEIDHHKKEIERLQKEIERHKHKIKKLKDDD
ncbi:PREDICTED: ATPase inhibitor, mitochondrial [Tinamus guttatus]|uniref:ATPase inhibitor, mitochondrial n=1 Tax=Tinamus guttatus TaxID=94827 RepID=UPI00052E6BB2|nr:PREDICTED: ATPase inhibitor, mitochondrial [Tinamus guttatus]